MLVRVLLVNEQAETIGTTEERCQHVLIGSIYGDQQCYLKAGHAGPHEDDYMTWRTAHEPAGDAEEPSSGTPGLTEAQREAHKRTPESNPDHIPYCIGFIEGAEWGAAEARAPLEATIMTEEQLAAVTAERDELRRQFDLCFDAYQARLAERDEALAALDKHHLGRDGLSIYRAACPECGTRVEDMGRSLTLPAEDVHDEGLEGAHRGVRGGGRVTDTARKLDVMTLEEVADYLRISIHTVRDWRRRGILPVYKLPTGTIRVKRSDVEAMLRD